ncbi:MAG TPA: histidine phosphatase family protein [Streptosporangiaceae bacterium]|nr:histidine phosphatase family protein [Streptosporangiaceae bacterium]
MAGTAGLRALYSSPLKRAQETAAPIASAAGLAVQLDTRLREGCNWEGGQTFEDFLADWTRSTRDRDFVLRNGESSRSAGERMRAFLEDLTGRPRPRGCQSWRGHYGSVADSAGR